MVGERKKRVIDEIEPWIEFLWNERGTDLLITAGAPPMVRVNSEMRPIEGVAVVDAQQARRIVHSVLGEDLLERYDQMREVDFAFDWQLKARLRCNAFFQRDTSSVALRMIPYAIPQFDDLGLPPGVE